MVSILRCKSEKASELKAIFRIIQFKKVSAKNRLLKEYEVMQIAESRGEWNDYVRNSSEINFIVNQ